MNFASLIRARWLPLVLASLLAIVAGQAAAQLPTKPGKYGKTLVADVVLSPSQIDKFTALLDTLAASTHGSQNSVMFGDTADWLGTRDPGRSWRTGLSLEREAALLTAWRQGRMLGQAAAKRAR